MYIADNVKVMLFNMIDLFMEENGYHFDDEELITYLWDEAGIPKELVEEYLNS